MGIPDKQQIGKEKEAEVMWVIAGIPLRAPLKPIKIRARADATKEEEEIIELITPTEKEARIPEMLLCPPTPKKRRRSPMCDPNEVRFFATPDDLSSMFARCVEREKKLGEV